MRIPNLFKGLCIWFLSVSLSHLPNVAFANSQMISTSQVVEQMSREQAQEKVTNFVQRADVQEMLVAQGISAHEANARLATLSQSELNQFAVQIEEAKAGGILVTILVVVLIIFLVQRI
jgi:hypothetical protein